MLIVVDKSLNYGRTLIRRYLKDADYSTVLDIGAGAGTDLLPAREFNQNVELNAIECHDHYLNILRSIDIDAHKIDIEKDRLPFPDRSMDVVIVNQVIEHTKEIFWIFHEISRVLADSGTLIVGMPNLASLHNRLLLLFGIQPTQIKAGSAHVRGYTKNDFLKFLEAGFPGGYRLCHFGGCNFYPFPPFVAKPLARMFPSMAWGILFKLEKRKRYANGFLEYPASQSFETNFYLGE